MKRVLILILIIIVPFSGCKKDNTNTEETGARNLLYEIMQNYYFWYNEMPAVDIEDYSNPADLLEALRYTDRDKWSFVMDYDEFQSEMSGGFVGHGIRVGLDDNNIARIVTIYSGSDMYKKGVRRGWIIKTINGTPLAPILIAKDATAYNNLMGESTAGIINTFVFENPEGTEVTISSTKSSFTINTVLDYDTLKLSTGVTGYLCFDSFLSNSPDSLNLAFKYFSECGATNLIVDLRYNTGGLMDVAQLLSSYVIGNNQTTTPCYKLIYNNLCSKYNQTFYFVNTSYPMNLSKVVFITSGSSASASEVTITSLMPYLDVTLVGSKTYGKPCGMNVWYYKKAYAFVPITFEYTNANDYGGFFDGIPVDIAAADDITHDFGDRNEASIAAAINFLEGGTKTKSSTGNIYNTDVFIEGKKLPSNLLIEDSNQINR